MQNVAFESFFAVTTEKKEKKKREIYSNIYIPCLSLVQMSKNDLIRQTAFLMMLKVYYGHIIGFVLLLQRLLVVSLLVTAG